MSSRKSIFLPLVLSGVAACVQKIAEGAIAGPGSTLAVSIGAYGVVAATSVLAGLLVNRASSAADAAERDTLATRNHHLRRGMARALRVALERYRDANKDLPANPYNTLFETWDFVLQLSETDNAELDRFFPIDLTEAQWKATSTYSNDDEEDANALLELLRTLLERDAVYPKWGDDEAIRFAKDLLPYYRQVFADDLAGDGDGFIKNAFDIKSQNELRSLLEKVTPELEKIRSMVSPQSTLLLMQFQPRTDGFSRFVYDQAKDDFVGRDHVVERLTRGFLSPRKDDPHKFQWHLVVGAAGVGKSRLGFQLTADAGSAWPISGFIEPSMIQDANWLGWMPEHPAFLVVDNVLRDSTGVKKLLDGLTVADSHSRLAHPVRLLLLERLANVELVESLFEHCPNSRAVLARRFEKEPITLEPLEKDAYLQIARGRDPEKKLDRFNDDALERSLKEIDPECRPLFAALLGEDLSSAPDDDIHVSLSSESTRERRRELLERVIGRDRKFWENLARASYQDSKKAENLLESHERLLALATITRGFSRSRLEPAAFGPSLYLPGDREFDKALYARMSDQVITADADFLSPLEPDLIGELFVLNLIKDNKRVQRALIDLAWKLDPVGSSFFAGMAEVDYGTADTPPLRLLPAPSQVTAEMAPSVTHALRAVSRALSYRTIDAHPETHPPWTFPDFDELETKKFLREQFNQSRQTVPPSDGPLPRG